MIKAEYLDLYIIESRTGFPVATVSEGSVVQRRFFGITRWHALGRAARWARARSTRFVYVQKWGDTVGKGAAS